MEREDDHRADDGLDAGQVAVVQSDLIAVFRSPARAVAANRLCLDLRMAGRYRRAAPHLERKEWKS